jgi:hypothetical protein
MCATGTLHGTCDCSWSGREQEENRLQVELCSLGMDCKRKNELNGKEELEALDKEGWPRVDY